MSSTHLPKEEGVLAPLLGAAHNTTVSSQHAKTRERGSHSNKSLPGDGEERSWSNVYEKPTDRRNMFVHDINVEDIKNKRAMYDQHTESERSNVDLTKKTRLFSAPTAETKAKAKKRRREPRKTRRSAKTGESTMQRKKGHSIFFSHLDGNGRVISNVSQKKCKPSMGNWRRILLFLSTLGRDGL